MESCWAAAVLNGVDRRALQRSARLGREVLERARRRAVNWHAQEHPRGSVGVLYREGPCQGSRSVPGPQRLLPAEREERLPTLSASFQTMAEFMDYTSSQCGKYYSSVLEEGGATHVYRYHRRRLPERHASSDADWGQNPGVPGYTLGSQVSEKSSLLGKDREKASLGLGSVCETSESAQEASQPAEDTAKDLYIEVYPGTYSVTVGSSALTKKTHVVAVDSGQSVDLVFPV